MRLSPAALACRAVQGFQPRAVFACAVFMSSGGACCIQVWTRSTNDHDATTVFSLFVLLFYCHIPLSSGRPTDPASPTSPGCPHPRKHPNTCVAQQHARNHRRARSTAGNKFVSDQLLESCVHSHNPWSEGRRELHTQRNHRLRVEPTRATCPQTSQPTSCYAGRARCQLIPGAMPPRRPVLSTAVVGEEPIFNSANGRLDSKSTLPKGPNKEHDAPSRQARRSYGTLNAQGSRARGNPAQAGSPEEKQGTYVQYTERETERVLVLA